jgi:hypothetical protein
MIRYAVGREELIERIRALSSGWLGKALERTEQYVQAQDYTGGPEFWGLIKQVYIELQHEKCAYCETKLQGAAYARKVHEVEHFRPKSSVKGWPDRKKGAWSDFPAHIATGSDSAKGYFALAYHPFNYAIACTRCNSTLKSNYFPLRGPRDTSLVDPSLGQSEDALLVYPVSDIDTDPAQLIAFDGVLAVPRHHAGANHERALTTIYFFDLNHQDLTTRRAEMMGLLWGALESQRLATDALDREFARETIDMVCSDAGQFSACMQAFRALYQKDRANARKKALQARQLGRALGA